MANTQANIAKIIVDSLLIMDTASEDGVTAIATVSTSADARTCVVTGITATLNSLAGMDLVVFAGAPKPEIRTIVSNTATSAGSTTITVGVDWANALLANGSKMQIAPSAIWVNLGLAGEVPLKIGAKKGGLIPMSDLGTIQKGYELAVIGNALQVVDAGTIEGYKNKVVWLKANAASSSAHTIIIRNVRLNIEADLDLAVKGVSVINLVASQFIRNYGDAIVIA